MTSSPTDGSEQGTPQDTAEPLAAGSAADQPGAEAAAAKWIAAEWHGRMILASTGERIGRLQDVYVDVETDEPKFGTVREGFIQRHLTFIPLAGVQIGPESLQITATYESVKSAPNLALHGEEMTQADESALYHHFGQNYLPAATSSGRRLARR